MASGKRCFKANELSLMWYDKFVTGNGNPCFKRNGNDVSC